MKHKIFIISYAVLETLICNYAIAQNGTSTLIRNDSTNFKNAKTSFAAQICMVTVDNISDKNEIIWEKSPGESIKEYKIEKETSTAGQYIVLDTVPYIADGIYVDNSSDPSKHADRYILIAVDSFGNESEPSGIHQTIHLEINQGLSGTYNLIWSPYIGFDYSTYYIYKGSSEGNLKLIDSLANTYIQYTDTAVGVAYYQVAVRKSSPCLISKRKSGSEPFSQSVSNLEDNLKFVDIKNISSGIIFNIHPNPFKNEFVIEGNIMKPSPIQIEVFNVLGMKIYDFSTGSFVTGNYKKVIQTNELIQTSEINVLKITTGEKIFIAKIIKY